MCTILHYIVAIYFCALSLRDRAVVALHTFTADIIEHIVATR